MSFSSETKSELAQIIPEDRCCMLSEISGFVRMCGTIRLAGPGKVDLHLVTEHAAGARMILKLIKKYFGMKAELIITKNQVLKKNHIYELVLSEEGNCRQMLHEMGILKTEGGALSIDYGVPEAIVKKRCCKRAFLRGAFLGAGSLSHPEKAYHLELVTSNESLRGDIVRIMKSLGLGAKTVERKKHYVVYLKESEQIVDFLNMTGAHRMLLEFENVRIVKDMRNRTNRISNCDYANIEKTTAAAEKQIAAIRRIQERKGIDWLPPKLREIAVLRLEEPGVSLKELGERMEPPLGKSGVNHRLAKIEELAQKL